jgi:hypothetical protein
MRALSGLVQGVELGAPQNWRPERLEPSFAGPLREGREPEVYMAHTRSSDATPKSSQVKALGCDVTWLSRSRQPHRVEVTGHKAALGPAIPVDSLPVDSVVLIRRLVGHTAPPTLPFRSIAVPFFRRSDIQPERRRDVQKCNGRVPA